MSSKIIFEINKFFAAILLFAHSYTHIDTEKDNQNVLGGRAPKMRMDANPRL